MSASKTSATQNQIDPIDKGEASSNQLHEKAFDNSLLANIIFIVSDGRIIKANRAACKLLGYSKKELLTKHRKDIFNVSEESYKKMIRERKSDGSAKAELSIIGKTGKLMPCEITSVIFKDENDIDNSILSIVDLRERLLKQKRIDVENEIVVDSNIVNALLKSDILQAENKDWIKSIANSSYDVIWDWDIITDEISFGNTYDKIFGYKLKNKISFKEWMDLFQPEEMSVVKKKINKIFYSKKTTWEDTYSFTGSDGSVGKVVSRANIIRDANGKATRMIGVIHDTSKLQKLEEVHDLEIRIKERQIIEAIVEAKEMERSDIGMELHDNINQLLAASKIYLDMARKDIRNGDIYLLHSSEYTMTAIEEIRKLTKGLITDTLKDFGLCNAIEDASRDTMEAYPVKIHCVMDHSLEEAMSVKFKLNAFRIFQEQLNNTLKHAQASEIFITVSQTKEAFMFSISDDGIGFDTKKKADGVGISNITSRAELYKGNANFISEPGKGCMLVVTFPLEYIDLKALAAS